MEKKSQNPNPTVQGKDFLQDWGWATYSHPATYGKAEELPLTPKDSPKPSIDDQYEVMEERRMGKILQTLQGYSDEPTDSTLA